MVWYQVTDKRCISSPKLPDQLCSKVARAWRWLFPPSAEGNNAWSYTPTPPSAFMACKRDNFTFYYIIMIQSTSFINKKKYFISLCPYWKEEKKTVAELKRILVLEIQKSLTLLACFQYSKAKYSTHSSKTWKLKLWKIIQSFLAMQDDCICWCIIF